MVDQDGEVHVLHSFFSIPVVPYATKKILLAFRGGLPSEVLPPISKIPVTSLVMWRAISAVTDEKHIVHVEEISPSDCQTMPCEREVNKEDGSDLA